MKIDDKYAPQQIEPKWYDYWMRHDMFHSEPDEREPYTVVIPPPNVTGMLHMGHMLNETIQDVLVRRARMQGKNACWVPGTDHASIATEAKVVQKLKAEGIDKSSLTREEFLRHAWEWKEKHGGIILSQLRKLGASCDWARTKFTMDPEMSRSVIKVFVDLYNKGKIYRGVRMVNWDPAAQTALSDEEVVYRESQGKLYYLRYRLEGTDRYLIVATTRPETILGDTALCVNPDDERYKDLSQDARVVVPLVGRSIPVIRDSYVDIEFGTGALKVTPAHDVNDYMLGEKYNLEIIDIFNDDGTLNEHGERYAGMDRFEVRRQIEKDLADAGLLEKDRDKKGSLTSVLIATRDCTAEKERELEQQRQLREAVAQARRADAAKTDFLRRMSHDIRTPINGIRGMVEIARHYVGNEAKQEECREKIMVASGFLLELVNNVLDMNKLESGEVQLEAKPFCVRDLVEESAAMVEAQTADAGHAERRLVLHLSGEVRHFVGSGDVLQL